MRIISKFKDYYDGVQGYGTHDDELVYVRSQHELAANFSDTNNRKNAGQHELVRMLNKAGNRIPPALDSFGRGVINFCGKRYPFWCVTDYSIKGACKTLGFYDYDSIMTYLTQQPLPEHVFAYNQLMRSDKRYRMWNKALSQDTWNAFVSSFTSDNALHHKSDELFLFFNSPIIVYYEFGHEKRVIINANLSQFSFARVVDPFTAFQEISMFVGNNLANNENPDDLAMTDVQRAATKGFDKWSFRTKVR